jgi:large subunit ribosomal protein L30
MALKVTYKKSTIGYSKDQKATVRSLGLRKLHQSVIHNDTPTIRGMIFKVKHLVSVEEVNGDAQPEQKKAPQTTVVRARETSSASVAPASAGTSNEPEAAPTIETNASSVTGNTGDV